MNTIIHITQGFKLDDVFFGWHNGVLYQLPYKNGNKYFGLRVMKQKQLKQNGWLYYHLRRNKVGVEKLRALIQQVDWQVPLPATL
jgi:hypothetical protein